MKLTDKQETFIHKLLEHKDMVIAFSEVYNVSQMKPSTILRRASELLDNPDIQRRYQEITGISGEGLYNRLTERLVLERLKHEAMDPKNPPNVRVRALEILGKPIT